MSRSPLGLRRARFPRRAMAVLAALTALLIVAPLDSAAAVPTPFTMTPPAATEAWETSTEDISFEDSEIGDEEEPTHDSDLYEQENSLDSPAEPDDTTEPHPTDSTESAEDTTEESTREPIESRTLVGFKAGNIISDKVFFDNTTMTTAQIDSFLRGKVSKCQTGYVCLKDFTQTSVNRPADSYCKGYTGARNESAATIISRVSQSCGINPQVLIVMLQKEQGLITHTWPSQWRYDAALGQGCPDDAPCDPNFVGFFHQIYGAARQMKIYAEGKYFTWYAPGNTWQIQYHPNKACGTAPVYIENAATAGLYYYTPYQPNAAAMKAGYGEGDACSAYGNRNFYNYFTDWFGSTQTSPLSKFTNVTVKISGNAAVGQTLTAVPNSSPTATTQRFQWYRANQPLSGQTGIKYQVTQADAGKGLHVRMTAQRSGYQDASAQSPTVTPPTVTVDRLYGRQREDTGVAISRAAWPSGARTVFLATSRDFADALSGAAISSRSHASLLLTLPSVLPASVEAELRRLEPTRVIFLGGEGVLSSELYNQVKAVLPKVTVDRFSGANRYATSRAIVESVGSSAELFIATGRDYPDALSAAAAGNATNTPVLLVDGLTTRIDDSSLATIRKVNAKTLTIVGGIGVVSAELETHLKQLGFTVHRVEGRDRYLTNTAVNERFFPSSALRALIASGEGFPDALSASTLSGRWQVPLLLSGSKCVPIPVGSFLRAKNTEAVTLVGGPGALGERVFNLQSCA